MSMSAKEVAREFGTEPRTFRKFLRSITDREMQPGQGGRWTFEQKELKKLKKQYDEWSAGKKLRQSSNGTSDSVEIDETDVVEVTEVLKPAKKGKSKKSKDPVVHEIDEEGPTAEELEAIELNLDDVDGDDDIELDDLVD